MPISIHKKRHLNSTRVKQIGLIGSLLLFLISGFAFYQLDRSQRLYRPGFVDIFDSREWDRDSISHFLDFPLSEEVSNLMIEGKQGLVGSYGIYPKLTFSFTASPETVQQFVEHFCSGLLHKGYDPLNAIDSSEPSDNAVLVRGKGAIHYSYSPNTPDTIYGNRCSRYDERFEDRWVWLEEITLDISNPNEYTVSYYLPFEPNSAYPEEYYPHAHTINPFGDELRLNITGFTDDYVLEYHTICMETAVLAGSWEALTVNPDAMSIYAGAEVRIFIDAVEQPKAQVSESLGLHLIDTDNPPDRWEYCLVAEWEAGVHTMQIVIEPLDADILNLEWVFEMS